MQLFQLVCIHFTSSPCGKDNQVYKQQLYVSTNLAEYRFICNKAYTLRKLGSVFSASNNSYKVPRAE